MIFIAWNEEIIRQFVLLNGGKFRDRKHIYITRDSDGQLLRGFEGLPYIILDGADGVLNIDYIRDCLAACRCKPLLEELK
jgi:hypothetical protein